jgi:endonuclease/exonuclease/phosphatase family metal-dependent hydrolase
MDHDALCWGSNRYGQLGDGQASMRVSARAVGGTWASVDAGWFSVCARPLDGGDSRCWGNNERGQLGTGDRKNRSTAFGRTSTKPFPTRAAKNPDEFVTTTFNVLGSQHTEPGGGSPEWGPGRLRTEWAANLIQSSRSSLLAFQETQTDQIRTLERIIGDRYDSWPGTKAGARAGWQTVMWDSKRWTMEANENVDLPVLGKTRPHPLVLLRNIETGKKVWVFNIHNSSKQTPERKRERAKAMKIILAKVNAKRADGTPVILLGDFNDRATAFCSVTGKTDLKATIGGSNRKGKCRPPRNMGIDWIFASKDLEASNATRSRTPMIMRISDHPVVSSLLRFK